MAKINVFAGMKDNRCFFDYLLNDIGGCILSGREFNVWLQYPSYRGVGKGRDRDFFEAPADRLSRKKLEEVDRVIRKGCATRFGCFNDLREFVRGEFGLKDCDVCIAFGDSMLGWFFHHDIYRVYSLEPKPYSGTMWNKEDGE